MTDMRILTVRQPWAWAIMHGGKTVENRARNIAGDYRGPVAIHAAKSDDYAGLKHRGVIDALMARTEPEPWRLADLPRGVILGTVDLTDVHPAGKHYEHVAAGCYAIDTKTPACCPPWGDRDRHHLILANPRPLAEPIPYRGALGMRRLDQHTIDQITASLEADTERTTPDDEPHDRALHPLPADLQLMG